MRSAFCGGLGSQPTQYGLGPRPTSVPSGILIRPTVWPQYANVTNRQDRQTGQTGQTGHRCRNIGRTATCNGRPMTSECSSLVIDDKSRVGLDCCSRKSISARLSPVLHITTSWRIKQAMACSKSKKWHCPLVRNFAKC